AARRGLVLRDRDGAHPRRSWWSATPRAGRRAAGSRRSPRRGSDSPRGDRRRVDRRRVDSRRGDSPRTRPRRRTAAAVRQRPGDVRVSWPLASFLLVAGVLAIGWLVYERRRPSARMAAVVAVMAAL